MSIARRRERRHGTSVPAESSSETQFRGTMGVFLAPLGLTAGLLALSLLPRIQQSAALAWSFWVAAVALLIWQGLLALGARRDGPPVLRRAEPRPQHYIQGVCHLCVYAYWGWYWPPVYDYAPLLVGAAPLRLRVRHPAGLVATRGLRHRPRAISDHLQHEPVPVVQGRLVLPAIRARRRGFPGQGVRAMGPRRPARPHLQSVCLHPGPVLAGAAGHRHDQHHVGPGDSHHVRAWAAHLPGAVPRRPGRHVLLLDDAGDGLRCRHAVRGERAVSGGDRRALLRRLGDSGRGVPRAAPAGHRSVHFAAHALWARHLRRAVRPRGRRLVRHARRHGAADVLRQAAVRAAC